MFCSKIKNQNSCSVVVLQNGGQVPVHVSGPLLLFLHIQSLFDPVLYFDFKESSLCSSTSSPPVHGMDDWKKLKSLFQILWLFFFPNFAKFQKSSSKNNSNKPYLSSQSMTFSSSLTVQLLSLCRWCLSLLATTELHDLIVLKLIYDRVYDENALWWIVCCY